MSNRRLIVNAVTKNLQKIDGRTSPYDPSYEFYTDIHNNAYRGLRYIDEINDFPSLYLTSGLEQRVYQSKGLTESVVSLTIRCYVYGEEPQQQLSNLIKDIEHVIYNMSLDVELQVQDISVKEILTDSGLLEPYGMAEIFLNMRFEIFNN